MAFNMCGNGGVIYATGAACYRWFCNKPGLWLVSVGNYGAPDGDPFCSLHYAVIDDFGNLVKVPR